MTRIIRLNMSVVISIFMLASCTRDNFEDNGPLYNIVSDSAFQPLFHFTPPHHWMNDPNGLVFYKGKYHLFYQFNPNASVWGPMNWGHATSTDLFNWQDEPVALTPDNSGTIFSGSVVVDVNNTSGFKTGTEDPLVAVYTINGTAQHQGIAYSTDGGNSWTKYVSNPVLANPGVPDFRDPKVFWHAASQKWIMVLAVGNKMSFYTSGNLKSWTFAGSFGENAGAHGGVWECPDLFQLPVEGSSTSKWVLLASINPGGPNGGSGTQYFVGNFNGTTFTNESSGTSWLDYGTDNYAGITYNNIPAADNRRIFIGWMSNWTYAQQVPTSAWRSTMTTPRTLSLAGSASNYILKSKPVTEIEKYRTTETTMPSAPAIDLTDNSIIKSGGYQIDFSADLNLSNTLSVTIGNDLEKMVVSYNKAAGQFTIDRSASGQVEFNAQFKQTMVAPYVPGAGKTSQFQILVDKTSIELFVDNGERVMTALFFPTSPYDYVKVRGEGASAISNFRLKGLSRSIMRQ